jgi:hypothetical protein
MCTWYESLDGRPGTFPETRILSDATVLVVFQISWGDAPDPRGRLVLRFDREGDICAALQQEGRPQDTVENDAR